MKQGELVRLKQPFQPALEQPKSYQFGMIAAFAQVKGNHRSTATPEACILLHLYDPDRSSTYIDEFGTEALFAFQSHEVEPC